ncbi:RICIN domain-containing protein [Saccharothrix violaceirubra]|uniref:Uncharacterized protein n=2 Tax=Saccharothrix violaceirubra TaxID=413306 RepID=A0A7W7SZL4_9PSEU|nr:hypothetical protein [Saccharothrix violaceirubra]MBB4963891.1 hypothetical protein [Saccharothrix violaceirubra]
MRIVSAMANGGAFAVNGEREAVVVVAPGAEYTPNAQWYLEIEGQAAEIRSKVTPGCLQADPRPDDPGQGGLVPGNRLIVGECSGEDDQLWRVAGAPKGRWTIGSLVDDTLVLSVGKPTHSADAEIWLGVRGISTASEWTIEPFDS